MNKFEFIKTIYREYVVVIIKKDQKRLDNFDKRLLNYLHITKITELKRYNINYIIIDNKDEILYEYKSICNNYSYYIFKCILNDFIDINYKEYLRRHFCEK